MDTGRELRAARRAAGLSQRALADAAQTSQAAVAAYETGRRDPSVTTLARLLAACGATLEIRSDRARLERAGRHLAEVLALAEALPYRPRRELAFPRLPA